METLVFRQASWWKSAWELYEGERLVGSLAVTSGWSWARAEGRIGEKRYEFGYRGWMSRFFVRDASGALAEETSRGFFSSVTDIELAGKRYALSSNWCSAYTATDESGAEVVRVRPRYWKHAGEASMQDPSREAHLVLALLLFYRMQFAQMSAAVVVPIMSGAFVAVS